MRFLSTIGLLVLASATALSFELPWAPVRCSVSVRSSKSETAVFHAEKILEPNDYWNIGYGGYAVSVGETGSPNIPMINWHYQILSNGKGHAETVTRGNQDECTKLYLMHHISNSEYEQVILGCSSTNYSNDWCWTY